MTTRISRREYTRVREDNDRQEGKFEPNDIHVVASRGQRTYIVYAVGALTGSDGAEGEPRQKYDSVTIRGMGTAVYNVVNIAEIVKRSVKGLHQITEIGNLLMKDKYEHKESKEPVERERKVTTISIKLSTKPLDVGHPGYQAPLDEELVTGLKERPPRRSRGNDERGRGGRGRGRGGFRATARAAPGRREVRDRDDDRPRRGRRGGRRDDDYDDRPRRTRRDDDYDERPRRPRRDDRDDRRPPRRDDRDDRRPPRRDDRDDRRPPRRDDRDDRRPPRRDDRDDRRPPRRDDRDDRYDSRPRAPRGGRGGRRDY